MENTCWGAQEAGKESTVRAGTDAFNRVISWAPQTLEGNKTLEVFLVKDLDSAVVEAFSAWPDPPQV